MTCKFGFDFELGLRVGFESGLGLYVNVYCWCLISCGVVH